MGFSILYTKIGGATSKIIQPRIFVRARVKILSLSKKIKFKWVNGLLLDQI